MQAKSENIFEVDPCASPIKQILNANLFSKKLCRDANYSVLHMTAVVLRALVSWHVKGVFAINCTSPCFGL